MSRTDDEIYRKLKMYASRLYADQLRYEVYLQVYHIFYGNIKLQNRDC